MPGLAALMIIIVFVRENTYKTEAKFTFLKSLKNVAKARFLWLMAIVSVFSLGASNFSFVLQYGSEVGINSEFIPLLFALVNVAYVAVAIPPGALADRIGKERMLFVGYTVFLAVTLTILIGPASWVIAMGVSLLFGLYQGIGDIVARAMIPEYVKPNMVGTAYGIYYLTSGFSFLFANLITGTVWSEFGPSLAVLYSITLTMTLLLGFIFFSGK